jgi:hypothetical protein
MRFRQGEGAAVYPKTVRPSPAERQDSLPSWWFREPCVTKHLLDKYPQFIKHVLDKAIRTGRMTREIDTLRVGVANRNAIFKNSFLEMLGV